MDMVCAMKLSYETLKRADEGDMMLCFVCMPVLIWCCNLGATCAVTSTHIIIILESLLKPGDDTLGDSKFLGYFQLDTSIFQTTGHFTTRKIIQMCHLCHNYAVIALKGL
ncbi:uncharacterized protein TNCV_4844721 [Trichonephila clavipes]|uniref:Uncharacterized protein n=1 Tax=Trichonephila clavipes TaxID=2585209 RepID=A0A8X6WJV9_TRICX|nr:uncharacterized protein TNCV_4844721 [Trichonephila clavipes]